MNSFTGIDPSSLTMGIFNGAALLEGNNSICYGLGLTLMQGPDILPGLYSDVDPAVDLLGSTINNLTDARGCPTLNNYEKDQFSQYPGYTNSRADGTDPSYAKRRFIS
jgi:hypothetical protein